MGMDKLWESKRRIDEMNAANEPQSQPQPSSIRRRRTSGPKFEECHRRITTYLENSIYDEVELLRDQGKILNLTAFLNDLIREHLKKNSTKES